MRSDRRNSSHRVSGPATRRRCWAKSRSIRTKTGKIFDREQSDYEGGRGNPLSWEREIEKFHGLSEPFADAALRNDIIELVADLDQHSIEDLMNLLAKVSPSRLLKNLVLERFSWRCGSKKR